MAKLNVETLADNTVKYDGDVYVKTTGKAKTGDLVRANKRDVDIDVGAFYKATYVDSAGDPHFSDNDNDSNWIGKYDVFAKLVAGAQAKVLNNGNEDTRNGYYHNFSKGDIVKFIEVSRTDTMPFRFERISDGLRQVLNADQFELLESNEPSTQSFEDGSSFTHEGKTYTLRKRMPNDGELVLITEDGDSYYGKVTMPVDIDNSDDSISDDNCNWHYVEDGEFLTLEDADVKQPKSYHDGDTYEYEGKSYVLRQRVANIGEKLLIVDVDDGRYKNGDVFEVGEKDYDDNVYAKNGGYLIHQREYLVLEPIASAKSYTFTVRLINGRELTITDETAETVADLIAASVDNGDFVHAQLFTSMENIDTITIATKVGD